MLHRTHRLQRAAFAAGMLAAMGFGTAQAFAAPAAAAASKETCTHAQRFECREHCKIIKGGTGFICEDGRCICY